MKHYPRRLFLRDAAISALGLGVASRVPCRAADASYQEEFPDMLIASLTRQANALTARWDEERARIATRDETHARNQHVRARLRAMIGPDPERNELGAVTASILERDGYRIENVRFQSRPDFWVTANLYVPAGPGPFPAIIAPSGHYADANRDPSYQLGHILMAKHGFMVLAYDPIGQGERRHHWNPTTGVTEVGNSSFEHSTFGQRLLLLGENFSQYRIWDGMRAIDYLLTRREADPARIGCAGHSGGGWATLCITALDERVKCAICHQPGITVNHLFPIDPEASAEFRVSDAEHHLVPSALEGVDYCDIFQSLAPRPLLFTTEYTGGPRWHAMAKRVALTRAHVAACYARLGVPERFALLEAGDEHYVTHKLRCATVEWFSRWFLGKTDPVTEPPHEPEPLARLYCTPNGSLRYSGIGETIHGHIVKKQAAFPPARRVPGDAAECAAFRATLVAEIRRLLRCDAPAAPLAVRRIGDT